MEVARGRALGIYEAIAFGEAASAYRRRIPEMDAPRGFEPRLTESESVVLPLDDRAMSARRAT